MREFGKQSVRHDPVLSEINGYIAGMQRLCAEASVVSDYSDSRNLQILLHLMMQQICALEDFRPECQQALAKMEHRVYFDMLLSRVDLAQGCEEEDIYLEENEIETVQNSPINFQAQRRVDIDEACEDLHVEKVRLSDLSGRQRQHAVDLKDPMGHAGSWLSKARLSGYETVLGIPQEHGDSAVLVEVVRPSGVEAKGWTLAKQAELVYTTHMAHRDLVLSKYFPHWMGITKRDWLVYKHYRVVSMDALLRHCSDSKIPEDSSLAVALRYHLLRAFADLSTMSTFDWESALSTENVFWDKTTGQLLLGKIHWSDPADSSDTQWAQKRDVGLLRNYGNILERCFCGPKQSEEATIDVDSIRDEVTAKIGTTLVLQSSSKSCPHQTKPWATEDSTGCVERQGSDRFYLRQAGRVVLYQPGLGEKGGPAEIKRIIVNVRDEPIVDTLSPETRVLVEASKHVHEDFIQGGLFKAFLAYKPLQEGKTVDSHEILDDLKYLLS